MKIFSKKMERATTFYKTKLQNVKSSLSQNIILGILIFLISFLIVFFTIEWLNFSQIILETILKILENLDPSLFQSVILGVLAIFIPFSIVFLTDVLYSKKERSEFEKMVLLDEVFEIKKFFWFSVVGMTAFSFFSGSEIYILKKTIAIILLAIFIYVAFVLFRKILKVSEGDTLKFEKEFLKNIHLSKLSLFSLISFRDEEEKIKKMNRAWGSFWSGQPTHSEREFTKIFIEHIDSIIKNKAPMSAVNLIEIYMNNIDKRDNHSIAFNILPKIFEWHEKFLELKKDSSNQETLFHRWYYFCRVAFPKVSKTLFDDDFLFSHVFREFKKYIDGLEKKMEESKNENGGELEHIKRWFLKFCPVFFDDIQKISSKSGFLEEEAYFPKDWKITVENSQKIISKIVLNNFIKWTENQIHKMRDSNKDEIWNKVVAEIFPNIHDDLFSTFSYLFFFDNVKSAIKNRVNFSVLKIDVVSVVGEGSWDTMSQLINKKELSRKEETIKVIFSYFKHWKPLALYKEDLSQKEHDSWKQYSEEERKNIINRVRQKKLQTLLDKLESKEITGFCSELENKMQERENGYYEQKRKSFISLIELLLKHIPKN